MSARPLSTWYRRHTPEPPQILCAHCSVPAAGWHAPDCPGGGPLPKRKPGVRMSARASRHPGRIRSGALRVAMPVTLRPELVVRTTYRPPLLLGGMIVERGPIEYPLAARR